MPLLPIAVTTRSVPLETLPAYGPLITELSSTTFFWLIVTCLIREFVHEVS